MQQVCTINGEMLKYTQTGVSWKPNFEERHRSIEHSCKKGKDKLKCRALLETYIQREPKYKDKKGKEYPDIESFRNRTSLLEI